MKDAAHTMAHLNYTGSGGTNKKPDYKASQQPKPPQPFFRPPNAPPVAPKAPPLSAPPQTVPWQLNELPLISQASDYKLPTNTMPPTKAWLNSSSNAFSQLTNYTFPDANAQSKTKPEISASKNTALLLDTPYGKSNFGSTSALDKNPYIQTAKPDYPPKKNHQLYSYNEEDYKRTSSDTPNIFDLYKQKEEAQNKRAQLPKIFGENFAYGTEKLINGAIVSPLEGIGDFVGVPLYNGLSFLTGAGGLAKNKVSDLFAQAAQKLANDDISGAYSNSIDKRYPNIDELGRKTGQAVQFGGEIISLMIPGAAFVKCLSTSNKLLSSSTYLAKLVPYINKAIISMRSGGNAMEEASKEGASSNQSMWYGLTTAAFEFFSQGLSGGIPYMSKGVLSEWLKKATDVPAIKTMIDIVGEGGEGALRAFFEPLSKKAIYNPDQPLASGQELWSNFLQDATASLFLKTMTGQLDLSTKNINAAAKIESTKKQASDYIDKGTQNVNIARDMPVANRAFGSIYPHNKVPYEKLVNSFDRAGNKLYNELKNSAESALFAQETRSDLANAVSDATNSLLFKEQLKIIESNLGENSQSFINGMCEDILLELADDLASGGKASAKSIERKILGSFSDAVSISQEYKSSTSLVQDSSKTNTGDLFGANEFIRKNKREVLNDNKAKGKAFESLMFSEISATLHYPVEQITIRTHSGTKTRIDAVGLDKTGVIQIMEFKSSSTAQLTKNQQQAFPQILENGGVVVGHGKSPFVGGYFIPPNTQVSIIRPE